MTSLSDDYLGCPCCGDTRSVLVEETGKRRRSCAAVCSDVGLSTVWDHDGIIQWPSGPKGFLVTDYGKPNIKEDCPFCGRMGQPNKYLGFRQCTSCTIDSERYGIWWLSGRVLRWPSGPKGFLAVDLGEGI